MKIENATVLVIGANRGIGPAFTRELLVRGARKVYAGVRDLNDPDGNAWLVQEVTTRLPDRI